MEVSPIIKKCRFLYNIHISDIRQVDRVAQYFFCNRSGKFACSLQKSGTFVFASLPDLKFEQYIPFLYVF
jgi:hypothetical protein